VLWPHADSLRMLRESGVPDALLPVTFHLGWALDIGLGIAAVLRYRVALVGSVMIGMTAVYLAFLSVGQPWQWIHPITPLAICIPLAVATLIMMAIDDDR